MLGIAAIVVLNLRRGRDLHPQVLGLEALAPGSPAVEERPALLGVAKADMAAETVAESSGDEVGGELGLQDLLENKWMVNSRLMAGVVEVVVGMVEHKIVEVELQLDSNRKKCRALADDRMWIAVDGYRGHYRVAVESPAGLLEGKVPGVKLVVAVVGLLFERAAAHSEEGIAVVAFGYLSILCQL
ncbi:MAG: hypothetical protein MMC23_002403 [Stictis urceolatum]|nr:hypothetical protein [Stictis urceolata]